MSTDQSLDFYKRATHNLGTFNNHFLPADTQTLFLNFAYLNGNDGYTYPEIPIIKKTCGEFLLRLCNAYDFENFQYHTTSGSAEAVFLGLLTLKRNVSSNQPQNKLNIIVASNAHVCWKKAADYLDLELRKTNIDEKTLCLNPNAILEKADENTIGVCATLGTPTTLLFDPIQTLNNVLAAHFAKTGQFIPIHVDAASGGFIEPFTHNSIVWGFELPHVYGINISSHKYGMVYPCLGWLLQRNLPCLEKMTHENDYLGSNMKRISLQFSHSAANLMVQHDHIQRMGFSGYEKRIKELFDLTTLLKNYLRNNKKFILFNSEDAPQIPGAVFTMPNQHNLIALVLKLKEKGWYLPTYKLPKPFEQKIVARVVIRHGFTKAHIESFIQSIDTCFT